MSKYTHHPKRVKKCVFCKYWMGDSQMKYINSIVGFEYETSSQGKCAKKNGALNFASYTCPNYVPNPNAEKLL